VARDRRSRDLLAQPPRIERIQRRSEQRPEPTPHRDRTMAARSTRATQLHRPQHPCEKGRPRRWLLLRRCRRSSSTTGSRHLLNAPQRGGAQRAKAPRTRQGTKAGERVSTAAKTRAGASSRKDMSLSLTDS
jgi:hypothetical protein